ncbi:hypothetical protein IIA16_06420 [bacterium]|nr:hypothetical protein [bacterium]
MFILIFVLLILALGIFFVTAGFKLWADHRNPIIPAAVRPSAWSAVVAWAIGAYLIWWIL